MIPTEELTEGSNRVLEVDNRLIIPINTNVRILITAADVLHSFTIPSLGIKADAIPGRLNQVNFLASRPGIASAFIPREGIVNECSTSAAVIRIRTFVLIGNH